MAGRARLFWSGRARLAPSAVAGRAGCGGGGVLRRRGVLAGDGSHRVARDLSVGARRCVFGAGRRFCLASTQSGVAFLSRGRRIRHGTMEDAASNALDKCRSARPEGGGFGGANIVDGLVFAQRIGRGSLSPLKKPRGRLSSRRVSVLTCVRFDHRVMMPAQADPAVGVVATVVTQSIEMMRFEQRGIGHVALLVVLDRLAAIARALKHDRSELRLLGAGSTGRIPWSRWRA